jgi:hypothetical protein
MEEVEEQAKQHFRSSDLVNQMLAAGAIKMEEDGSVSLVNQDGTQHIMGNK